MKNKEKKKKNFFTKFLLSILYFLLSIILVLALWFCFSALDKKKSIAMIPQNFHALVHTDSLYDAVNPLLDLQAADIFLSSENMSDFRGIFINLRSENIRNNKLIKLHYNEKSMLPYIQILKIMHLILFVQTLDFYLPSLVFQDLLFLF